MEPKIKLSKRHHYNPIFYLKGFLNNNNKFFVYKKESERILGEKSPKSYYFEWNRNTVLNRTGQLDDFIETKLYSYLDDILAKDLAFLREGNLSAFTNDYNKLVKFIWFVNLLICRSPSYDDYHSNQIELMDPKYLIPIVDLRGNDKSVEFYNNLNKTDLYSNLAKLSASMKGILPAVENCKNWRIFELPISYKNKYCLLISDNPVLIKDIGKLGSEEEIIILPLTSSHLLIKSNQELDRKIELLNLLHLVNIGIVLKSVKYVSSPILDILELYQNEAKKYTMKDIWEKLSEFVK